MKKLFFVLPMAVLFSLSNAAGGVVSAHMFKPSVSIKYNFSPNSLRLLPEGPIEFALKLKFSEDGVLDFEDLLGQLLAGIEAKMGKIKPISQADRDDLKLQLAHSVIKRSIHPVKDILASFDDDGDQYWDANGRLHMPMRMKVSGYRLDLVPKLDKNGELDLDDLVAKFQEAYRGVLSEVIK